MNELQFQDSPNEFGRPPQAAPEADFTGKLVQWGLASTRQQAEYLMIGVAVIVLVIAFFVYAWSGGGSVESTPVPGAVYF